MLKRTGLMLLGLLLVPTVALGQDRLIKNFSPADLERIIENDLQKEFAKDEQQAGILYDIKGTPYFAFFNSSKRFINFYGRMPANNVTLEQVNAWNRGALFSRAYLQNNNLVLEVPLSFAAGTNRDIVLNYYGFLEREAKGLLDFLKGN